MQKNKGAYSKPYERSKMEVFAKIFDDWWLPAIFVKRWDINERDVNYLCQKNSIIDVQLNSKYTSDLVIIINVRCR